MRKKLIGYVDAQFAHLPKSAQMRDLHDEILLNTLDRYDEEIAAGADEESAYRTAAESIGDLDELIEPQASKKGSTLRKVIAIALYVCAVIPVIAGAAFGDTGAIIGVCLMFLICATATYLLLTANTTPKTRRLKQLRALGIALYIVCVVPVIALAELLPGDVGETLGVCLMFLTAAAATGLVVYSVSNAEKAQKAAAATPAAAEKEPSNAVRGLLIAAYWIAAAALFSLLGNHIGWPYAWIVFPIAGAAFSAISGIHNRSVKKIATGLLWIAVSVGYLLLTVKTGAWYATWLLFPIGAALNGILSGIFSLKTGGKKE